MTATILLYAGSVTILLWGLAHIVPTRSVVNGFEPLGVDNRRVLTMEWVAEGMTLMFLGVLSLLATLLLSRTAPGAILIYRAVALMLVLLAGWTAVTGGRTAIVHFKICPVIKTAVAAALILGSAL
jgi:hypothetical protein